MAEEDGRLVSPPPVEGRIGNLVSASRPSTLYARVDEVLRVARRQDMMYIRSCILTNYAAHIAEADWLVERTSAARQYA